MDERVSHAGAGIPKEAAAAAQRIAVKLRRAEERVVIQYPTRAGSFKRLLGGDARKADLLSNVFVHAVLPNDDPVRLDVKPLAQALVDVVRKDEACRQLVAVVP